jgi:hypothetical protein
MDDNILAIYGLGTDFLNARHHVDDRPQKMTDVEVMTTALVAGLVCGGNFEHARALLGTGQYLPTMRSRRRVNRRLSQRDDLCVRLFALLGQTRKALHVASVYSIDRCPVAVGDHDRIARAKISRHAVYRGSLSSKKRDLYGLKLPLMVTPLGQPGEGLLTPGSSSAGHAWRSFLVAVPEGRSLSADKAYHDEGMEDWMHESAPLKWSPIRKKHSQRTTPPCLCNMTIATRSKRRAA